MATTREQIDQVAGEVDDWLSTSGAATLSQRSRRLIRRFLIRGMIEEYRDELHAQWKERNDARRQQLIAAGQTPQAVAAYNRALEDDPEPARNARRADGTVVGMDEIEGG